MKHFILKILVLTPLATSYFSKSMLPPPALPPLIVRPSSDEHSTDLHKAASGQDVFRNNYLTIASLIKAGHSVHAKTKAGWTPLHYAALGNSPPNLLVLLCAGADPNAKAVDGTTPLQVAANHPLDDKGLVFTQILLGAGAIIDAYRVDDSTSLTIASRSFNPRIYNFLKKYGDELEAKRSMIENIMKNQIRIISNNRLPNLPAELAAHLKRFCYPPFNVPFYALITPAVAQDLLFLGFNPLPPWIAIAVPALPIVINSRARHISSDHSHKKEKCLVQ